MNMLDVVREGPVRDLILALNHYISTGDHIGEGIVMEETGSGDYLVNLAYDPKSHDDFGDYQTLCRRLAEITAAADVLGQGPLAATVTEPPQPPGRFRMALLRVRPADVRRLARELVRTPGAAGWGSVKPLMDRHFPDVRAKILSGEGV